HFVHQGRGAPPLVFVHGFACAHTDWKFQLEEFKKTHEVVACDLRGHGATPGQPQECSIEHYGGDVAALVNNLELRGVFLIGHSMGCRVVLEAARLLPKRVAGVVLIDGSRVPAEPPPIENYAAFAENLFRQMFFKTTSESEAIVARAVRTSAPFGAELKRSPMKPGDTSPWLYLVRSYGARVEIVPDTGHFTQLEAPEQVNRLI